MLLYVDDLLIEPIYLRFRQNNGRDFTRTELIYLYTTCAQYIDYVCVCIYMNKRNWRSSVRESGNKIKKKDSRGDRITMASKKY